MASYKWVICRVTILITHIRGLFTPLITTHEPSSIKDPKASIKGPSGVLDWAPERSPGPGLGQELGPVHAGARRKRSRLPAP